MAVYKCVRKCHWLGKKWNVGDVVELEIKPPHHFVLTAQDRPNASLIKPAEDPWKVVTTKEVTSYSEIAKQSKTQRVGFASGLEETEEIPVKKTRRKSGDNQ